MSQTTVNITNVTLIAPVYQAVTGNVVPQGEGVIDAIKLMETTLATNLAKDWSRGPFPSGQVASAIVGPWTADLAGTAPPCVVQQITASFDGWGIPSDGAVQMATEITQQIGANAGLKGEFFGRWGEGMNAEVDYGLEYAMVPIDMQGTQGVMYRFAAGLVADLAEVAAKA